MSTEGHRKAMASPIARKELHRISDSAFGYLPREQADAPADEAADRPISEPWDAWLYVEVAAGALVLAFVAILANFFWNNWHVVAALFN